ncbi:MAG: hypothetical protein P8P30_02330 [Rickettsiales bacterium]|nr:hypothetical protein [Rickettsiales bacterium]
MKNVLIFVLVTVVSYFFFQASMWLGDLIPILIGSARGFAIGTVLGFLVICALSGGDDSSDEGVKTKLAGVLGIVAGWIWIFNVL